MTPESRNGGASAAGRKYSTGFSGNEDADNNKGIVGGGIFCGVLPEVCREDQGDSREMEKYGHGSREARNQKCLCWQGTSSNLPDQTTVVRPAAVGSVVKSLLSSKKAPHFKIRKWSKVT
jgi:hypothetical protein